jgi:hypothetical protein
MRNLAQTVQTLRMHAGTLGLYGYEQEDGLGIKSRGSKKTIWYPSPE